MNNQERGDLLSSAMLALTQVARAATPEEATVHRTAYQNYLAAANAAPWKLPTLRIVT